jgi:hypothetical protein
MSNILKFGPYRNVHSDIQERTFKNAQVFQENGAHFVTMDNADLILAADASSAGLFGYALLGFSPGAPRVAASGTYGSRLLTTVTGDKFSVYLDGTGDTTYRVPSDANYAAGMAGLDCDLVLSTNRQLVDVGTSSTNVLRIVGGIVGEAVVDVKVYKNQIAADT